MCGNNNRELAKHGEQIEQLEKRANERREAEMKIFEKLEEINKRIGELKTAQAISSLKIVWLGIGGGAVPAIITLILLLITGKI